MSLHYLIDGYNLLYALPEIPPGSWQEKRQALLRLLQQTRPQGKNLLTVVFDSREGGGQETQEQGITIVFTAGDTADEWLTRKVRAVQNPRTLIVVSNDQGIRMMVRGTGARFMTTAEFISKTSSRKTTTRLSVDNSNQDEITEEFKKKWL